MRRACVVALVAAFLTIGASVEAAVSRVVVVQATDAAGYAKSIEQGKVLLKSKGSVGNIRVWRARYAGESAGLYVVTIEYPNLEALAKDDGMMQADADVRTWLQGLDKFRKVVSDSIYSEVTP